MCVYVRVVGVAFGRTLYTSLNPETNLRARKETKARARMRNRESKKGSQPASQPASHPDKHIDSHTTNLEAPICFLNMQQFNKCKSFKFQNRGFQEIICFAKRGERFQGNAPRLSLHHDAHRCILNAQEAQSCIHWRA